MCHVAGGLSTIGLSITGNGGLTHGAKQSACMGSSHVHILSSARHILTHSDQMTLYGISLVIIGSGSSLVLVWNQGNTRTNADLLSVRCSGRYFNAMLVKIQTLLFRKMHMKVNSGYFFYRSMCWYNCTGKIFIISIWHSSVLTALSSVCMFSGSRWEWVYKNDVCVVLCAKDFF